MIGFRIQINVKFDLFGIFKIYISKDDSIPR